MGESELEEIQGLLLDMMLHGYMFLFWGTDETKVERWSKQDRWEVLYEWWLPSVYCNNRLQPSAKMLVGMKRIGQGPVEALRKFLWEHAIDHPKLPEIFDQYLIAGHNLRAVQYIE